MAWMGAVHWLPLKMCSLSGQSAAVTNRDGKRGLSPNYRDPLICSCLTTWGRHQGKAENMNRHHPGASLNVHYFYFEVYNWLPLNGLLISTWHSLASHSSQSATRYVPNCLFERTITKSPRIAAQTIHILRELLNTAVRNTRISKSSSSEHWQNGSATGRKGASIPSTTGKETCLGHITTAPREHTVRIIWSR